MAGSENLSSLRASKGSGSVTLAYNTDPGDINFITWATSSTPNSFSTPVQFNDQAAKNMWGLTAGWLSTGTYSAVAYSRTGGDGVYFDSFNNTGITDDGPVAVCSSFQTSPNPFMNVAIISFSLSSGSPVDLAVYDISGRLVKTLCDGDALAAGNHEMQWNGSDTDGTRVSAGVYLCRLSTTDAYRTLNMLVVR